MYAKRRVNLHSGLDNGAVWGQGRDMTSPSGCSTEQSLSIQLHHPSAFSSTQRV